METLWVNVCLATVAIRMNFKFRAFGCRGMRTPARFERVGAEAEHLGRETGLKEVVFIRG
jgi:hypothetical protein